jgi:RNA recognition motif-containing protein
VDGTGTSKGYGFVRFGNEQEQQTALATMVNAVGLGGKPIKVKA